MPNLLFHQNMLNFGGGAQRRNQAYTQGFTAIATAYQPANLFIQSIGFTEIINNTTASPILANFSQILFGQNVFSINTVACGRTALAKGPEFITIASLPPPYQVGRIFFHNDGHGIKLISDIAPQIPVPPNWATQVHPDATADYRGVVYSAFQIGGVRLAIGYLHNRYTDKAIRTIVRNRVPDILKLLQNNSQARSVYLGGDFNLSPAKIGNERTGIAYPYDGGYTTKARNIYDYFYCPIKNDPPPPVPAALVNYQTQGQNMSDHAGVSLMID